jgi:hypothetical protein
MRVGIVRNDLGPGIYIADVESRVQRNFSAEPPGQSRTYRKPTDTELSNALNTYGFLSILGTDAAASVDTSANFTLRIRASAGAPYSVIGVTSGLVTAKTTIRNDLNSYFSVNGLPFVASVTGANRLQINTTSADSGPAGYLQIDSVGGGSTLNTAVGFPVGGSILTGLSLAALKVAIYPTPTTINVSSANIAALSTFGLLSASDLANLVEAIAEAVAPRLVETGPALLSFVYGIMSKMVDPSFQPGGARIGLPAGVAAAIVTDDGVTPFVL